VSPRRRVESGEPDYFFRIEPKPPIRWGLPIVAAIATLLVAAAITASTLMLVSHERDHRAQTEDAAALGYVRSFMTTYTTLDPFNANAYADRVVAEGTGEFAENFKKKQNEILVQVARSEPSTGTVLEAGVQRRHEDGSADVLVAMKVTSKTPDGKSTMESGSRWIATTVKEGQQWKISNLVQVI